MPMFYEGLGLNQFSPEAMKEQRRLAERSRGTRPFEVFVHRRERGLKDATPWQADVYTPDGRDYHAVAESPQQALIDATLFWAKREGLDVKVGQTTAE